MMAVRLHAAGDLRVEEIADPGEPPEGFARLKVLAAGICGSDLHNYRTGQWISRSPSTAGHEFCGMVESVGSGAVGLKAGDRVVSDCRYWCGECEACQRGAPQLCAKLGFVGEVCDGGFAERVVLPVRLLYPVPPSLPDAVAAMAEPVAVALHAIRRIAPSGNEPMLIAGCGPIGGLAALMMSELGLGPIFVADRNPARAGLVCAVTGAQAVDLDNRSLEKAIGTASIRYALDATGNIAALRQLVNLVAPGGTLGLVGISHGKLDLDPNFLVERELSLIGCHAFSDEMPEAIRMLERCQGKAAKLIDREIGLSDVPAAYERLLKGEATGLKTIIRPQNN